MERKAKLAAAQADRLLEEEMKSPSKKKINKSSKVLYKKTSFHLHSDFLFRDSFFYYC